MNIESEIARLLALAEPLRALADDDLAKEPLTGIVDEINVLRAEQNEGRDPGPSNALKVELASALLASMNAIVEGADHDPEASAIKAELARIPAVLPAHRPGRPKK